MYITPPNGADSATINPAALNSPEAAGSSLRGLKRDRSPGYQNLLQFGDDGMSS
jgi:hypothetical protein